MKNLLSDIYANRVLLKEDKDNVVANAKELDSKIEDKHKAAPVKGQGADKVKDVEDPEEIKKYSDGEKAKEVKENMETNNTTKNAFEGSFERLFKATLNEEFDDMSPAASAPEIGDEIPTTGEEMVDEITDESDEVTDLVSDLKSVIEHLNSILSKLTDHEEHEDSEELEGTEEHEGSEGEEEESEEEDEEPFEEAVDLKEVPANAGKGLVGPKGKYEVKGAVKVTKGKASGGSVKSDDALKPAKAHDKALQSTKNFAAKSSVKVGDFFK